MVDEAFEVYNLDGELQLRIPLMTKDKYGAERMMYHRADLHEALKQRATSPAFPGREATVRTSSRVVDCDCERGTVVLASGEVISADLIVGADGIKSVVRESVLLERVSARPTGLSAYRMMISADDLQQEADVTKVIDPRRPCTTMVVGRDRRLIMGPARGGTIYSVVALVPDENMNEHAAHTSWTTTGDHDKMMRTFADFPDWAQKPLRLAERSDLGLWQLRDLDPLQTWYRGRAILIGDAAHAMLPTQGQGASQAIEDAEALGAFFDEFEKTSVNTLEAVARVNEAVFRCRYDRATTIQLYSRQAAKPATEPGTRKVNMNPAEFMDYNCSYDGALDWRRRQDVVSY
jgi:salicylate hydroxylase